MVQQFIGLSIASFVVAFTRGQSQLFGSALVILVLCLVIWHEIRGSSLKTTLFGFSLIPALVISFFALLPFSDLMSDSICEIFARVFILIGFAGLHTSFIYSYKWGGDVFEGWSVWLSLFTLLFGVLFYLLPVFF